MLGNMLDSESMKFCQKASHKDDDYRNIDLSTYKYNIRKPEQYTYRNCVTNKAKRNHFIPIESDQRRSTTCFSVLPKPNQNYKEDKGRARSAPD